MQSETKACPKNKVENYNNYNPQFIDIRVLMQ